MFSQEDVQKCFDYTEGHLIWKWHPLNRINKRMKGKSFGHIGQIGYIFGWFLGHRVTEHQLVFMYHNGFIPKEIDHIDRDQANNKIENLREITRSLNNLNHNLRSDNKTGSKGTYFTKSNKWAARIKVDKRTKFLGCFDTLDGARAARENAEKEFGIVH